MARLKNNSRYKPHTAQLSKPARNIQAGIMPSKIPGYIKQIKRKGLAVFLRERKEKRKLVPDHLLRIHQGHIAYSPFKCMKVSPEHVNWGDSDLTTKILGVYEKVFLDKIVELSKSINGTFIDIGASDGYYGRLYT